MKRLIVLLLTLVVVYTVNAKIKNRRCESNGGVCMLKEMQAKCSSPKIGFVCRKGAICCKKGSFNRRREGNPRNNDSRVNRQNQKKNCKTSKKCTRQNGSCISKNDECFGETDNKLCKKKKCTCCIEESGGSGGNLGTSIDGCQCGLVNEARIVGGEVVTPNKYPWMVGLYVKKVDRESYSCGGSIINERYVITAAHCLLNPFTGRMLKAKQIKVGIADHDQFLNSDDVAGVTKRVKVEKLMIADTFDFSTLDGDIGLIKLAEPLDFSADEVKPVCLPSDDSKTYEGENGIVTGWGYTDFNIPVVPDQLREVSVPILSQDCEGNLPASTIITDNMLCAGFVEGGKDACNGDSGGPLVVQERSRHILVGLVSFGYGCADPNVPGVYTRVSKFLDWIKDNTNDGNFCE